jgi:hypothetical protein
MEYDELKGKTSKPHLLGIIRKGSYRTRSLDGLGAVQAEKGEQVSIDEAKAKTERMLPAAAVIVLTRRLV